MHHSDCPWQLNSPSTKSGETHFGRRGSRGINNYGELGERFPVAAAAALRRKASNGRCTSKTKTNCPYRSSLVEREEGANEKTCTALWPSG